MSQPTAEPSPVVLKFLLIGDSGVGKSSLLMRFADNTFSTSAISTIGIDFKLKTIPIKNHNYKLQIWDTAGQERFRTITTAYYRGARGCVIVYDVSSRESFENVKNWCHEVTTKAQSNVAILILANKCDLESDRKVSKEEGEALAAEHSALFCEVSAKTDENVNNAFVALATKIADTAAQSSAPETNNPSAIMIGSTAPKSSACCSSGCAGSSAEANYKKSEDYRKDMERRTKLREKLMVWLKELEITHYDASRYADSLILEGYDTIESLKDVDSNEWTKLGVKSGHMKRILKKLSDAHDTAPSTPRNSITGTAAIPHLSIAPQYHNKHVMLSYEWSSQKLVKEVYDELHGMKINVWMDIEGGVSSDLNRDMASAVENAAAIVPFMNAAYQKSKNCEMEMNYSRVRNVAMIPVMATPDTKWQAESWLGVLTAGRLWIGLRSSEQVKKAAQEIVQQLVVIGYLVRTIPDDSKE